MRRLLLAICLLFCATTPCLPAAEESATETADPNKTRDTQIEWLKHHAVPVRTIDPTDDDFEDLMPLVDKIGSARVLALGEQSHGDGAAFLAKHRLVRFLHQKMGFDILAWESGMFDCREMDAALLAGATPEEATKKGIFPIWGASGHVLPVLQYAASTRKSGRRLEMAGFDCQFSSAASTKRYPEAIETFFDRIDKNLLSDDDRENLKKVIARNRNDKFDADLDSQQFIKALIDRLDDSASNATRVQSPREIAFIRRTLQNLLTLDQIRSSGKSGDPADTNRRDKAMGENLAWLAQEYYPGRKIIVWAASFHLMREAALIEWQEGPRNYDNTVPMGHVAHSLLGDDYYSVMFIAHHGKAGNPFMKPSDLPDSPLGSLSELLHATSTPYAFLDFRTSLPDDHWLNDPITARPLGYTAMTARWPKSFDAVFYTETMFPSTRDGTVPQEVRTAKPREDVSPIAKALQDYRKNLIAYGLGFDSVLPKEDWLFYDGTRMEKYPTDSAWPDVLGHVDTNPDAFRIVENKSDLPASGLTGPQALAFPLDCDVKTNGYATLLFLDGIAAKGNAILTSYASFVCAGAMKGNAFFESYATAFIQGDLSGRITGKSYFNLVVTGKFTGRIYTESYAMIYLLGGFEGDLELKRSRVYIAGHATEETLERIKGRGKVYLEASDLPSGEHKIGSLEVTVGQSATE